jgi:hypothetical protein
MDKEQAEVQHFEAVWEQALAEAREMVREWSEKGSELELVEAILEQEDLDREKAQESVRVAVEVAVKALAQLKVQAAVLDSQKAQD